MPLTAKQVYQRIIEQGYDHWLKAKNLPRTLETSQQYLREIRTAYQATMAAIHHGTTDGSPAISNAIRTQLRALALDQARTRPLPTQMELADWINSRLEAVAKQRYVAARAGILYRLTYYMRTFTRSLLDPYLWLPLAYLSAWSLWAERRHTFELYKVHIPPDEFWYALIDETFEPPNELEIGSIDGPPRINFYGQRPAYGKYCLEIQPAPTAEHVTAFSSIHFTAKSPELSKLSLHFSAQLRPYRMKDKLKMILTCLAPIGHIGTGFEIEVGPAGLLFKPIAQTHPQQFFVSPLRYHPYDWGYYRLDIDLTTGQWTKWIAHSLDIDVSPYRTNIIPGTRWWPTHLYIQHLGLAPQTAKLALDNVLLINYGKPLYLRTWKDWTRLP